MKKILIVDDSGLSRRTLRRFLEAVGYQLIEAQDGFAALEQYSLQNPDLVFLDLTMQGMHGLDVLSKLRELDPQARVVIATADIQSSSRSLATAGGASGFINKPFTEADVLAVVEKVLEGK